MPTAVAMPCTTDPLVHTLKNYSSRYEIESAFGMIFWG